ncbi:MAG: protein-tyrosine-phosphatase [Flavobacteriaceae bacterium]|nr:protein-tyrosine-phosphatase [Flavobacteriaceae bacterium]|tara:strand:+ start:43112 stop:43570 length:459 start_codon:yes stop_codon:yes gene_type:complete
MKRVLMVCLGNICRSPLAQGILEAKVDPDLVYVDSAGTAGYHVGNPPDPRSVKVARKNGLDISHQTCRRFSVEDFDAFDFIYAMDQSNYQNILNLARNANDAQKVKLILNEIDSNSNRSVPDPYYGGPSGFDNVYRMLDEACEVISNNLSQA